MNGKNKSGEDVACTGLLGLRFIAKIRPFVVALAVVICSLGLCKGADAAEPRTSIKKSPSSTRPQLLNSGDTEGIPTSASVYVAEALNAHQNRNTEESIGEKRSDTKKRQHKT